MALPNPDHPSFGTRPALYGLPSLPDPSHSVLRQAVDRGESSALASLAAAVGGVDALESLHARPWDEAVGDAVDDHVLDEHVRHRVDELLQLVDRRVGRIIDAEFSLIVRRVVLRLAVADPVGLCHGPVDRTAAAVVWLCVVANGTITRARIVRPGTVWSIFGVTSCLARTRALYASLAVAPARSVDWFAPAAASLWLADPLLLRSSTRSTLCHLRDAEVRAVERQRAAAPISALGGTTYQLRARPLVPVWAARGATEQGRTVMAVAFDDGTDRPHLVGLSVPDARHLVRLLGDALDAPRNVAR